MPKIRKISEYNHFLDKQKLQNEIASNNTHIAGLMALKSTSRRCKNRFEREQEDPECDNFNEIKSYAKGLTGLD